MLTERTKYHFKVYNFSRIENESIKLDSQVTQSEMESQSKFRCELENLLEDISDE